MAETFDVVFAPRGRSFRDVLLSLNAALMRLGWSPTLAEGYTGSEWLRYAPGLPEALFKADSFDLGYGKGERWLSITGKVRRPWLRIGSDPTFFRAVRPLTELKGILGAVQAPGTYAFGGVEGFIDDFVDAIEQGRIQDLRSNERLRREGFFWVDTLTPAQWKALLRLSPGMKRREVARPGELHIVLMWDMPYEGRAPRHVLGRPRVPPPELTALARQVADLAEGKRPSRGRARTVPKGQRLVRRLPRSRRP